MTVILAAAPIGARVVAMRIRIGTRKSAMALAQTEEIARRLNAAAPDVEVEIVKFETTGDQDQTSKLLQHGGKGGAFVAQIRDAVAPGELHAAMHSLKDMPGNEDTPGLVIGATLTRDPRRRCSGAAAGAFDRRFQAFARQGLQGRHQRGAARGLCAPAVSANRGDPLSRRCRYPRAQARQSGNAAASGGGEVGPADALIMARSGLERVGLASRIAYEFSVQEMLPAVGQGIVAVECAADDWQTRRLLSGIDDPAAHRVPTPSARCCGFSTAIAIRRSRDFRTSTGAQMTLTASVLDETGNRSSRLRAPARPIVHANSAARSGLACLTRARRKLSSAAGRGAVTLYTPAPA